VGRLLFLTGFDGGLDLIDQTLDLDRAIVLYIGGVLVQDEDVTETLATVNQVVELLGDAGDVGLLVICVLGLEEGLIPAETTSEVVNAHVESWGFVLFNVLGGEGVLAVQFLEKIVAAVSDRAVVPDDDVLKRLNKLSLDVPGSGCLDGCV